MSQEPQHHGGALSAPERSFREIPPGMGACTVCDELIEHLAQRPRVGERRKLKVHEMDGQRCAGSQQPGLPWIEAARLPAWDELSDVDKGRALMFVWKCKWEGSFGYAKEHYPATFRDHPMLGDLPVDVRCRYARDVSRAGIPFTAEMSTLDVARKRLGDDEFDRLYNLALDAERAA